MNNMNNKTHNATKYSVCMFNIITILLCFSLYFMRSLRGWEQIILPK
jgi:hypothetical protein